MESRRVFFVAHMFSLQIRLTWNNKVTPQRVASLWRCAYFRVNFHQGKWWYPWDGVPLNNPLIINLVSTPSVPAPPQGCQLNPKGWWIDTRSTEPFGTLWEVQVVDIYWEYSLWKDSNTSGVVKLLGSPPSRGFSPTSSLSINCPSGPWRKVVNRPCILDSSRVHFSAAWIELLFFCLRTLLGCPAGT